jgi:hypothetical protein
MRKPTPQFDPFSFIRIGMAIWVTDLMVAQKFAEAVREQNTLIRRAMRRRAQVRSFEIERKALPKAGPGPDRAATVAPAAQLKPVLVHGETGEDEVFLATPLDGVPIDAHRWPASGVRSGSRTIGYVFQRTLS